MSTAKVMRPLSASAPAFFSNTQSYSYDTRRRGSYSDITNNGISNSGFTNNLSVLLTFPAFVLHEFVANNNNSLEENKENVPSPSSSTPSSSSPLKSSNGTISSLPLKDSTTNYLAPFDFTTCDTRLCIGLSMIPHPAKRAKGGEDAYFISEDMKVIGVADGVGGWGDIGVDPALYSRMLMASGKYSADCTPTYSRDPLQIMADAYENSSEIQGSSTCCIVLLDGYVLKASNLGDSGFMVVRGTDIAYRTKEQQHSFNFPYQLGTGSADMPYHATCVTVNIQPGDLVIVGSDGLFDNLYDDEIVEITSQATEPMTIAQLIARHAHETACNKSIISPFAKAARENGYPLATGGKLDDISVIVARVVLTSDGNLTTFAA